MVNTMTEAFNYILEVCKSQGQKQYSFRQLVSVFENSTESFIPSNETFKNEILYSRVKVSKDEYRISRKSIDSLIHHRTTSTIYGCILLGYWGFVILIGCIYNTITWCYPTVLTYSLDWNWIRWIRRHITTPRLISYSGGSKNKNIVKHTLRIPFLFPTRLQSITIGIYGVLIVVFSINDYRIVYPNNVYGTRSLELQAYISDRTAILAITQLPLLFSFSGRNDLFMILTGWPYRTFSIFHRWIARCTTILIIIHGGLYMNLTRQNGDYFERWSLVKWRWAHVAFSMSISLMISSIFLIRIKFYEIFKGLHKLLTVFFVVGIWYHCITLGWMEFLYITIGIWLLDYTVRLFKIIVSGGVLQAECQVITETVSGYDNNGNWISKRARPHSIKVVVEYSGWWNGFPGGYIYLYFLKRNMFFQDHPFTLINTFNPRWFKQLVVVIRVKDGLTKKLGKWLETQPEMKATIPVLVEGPYGFPLAFNGYNYAVLIAGGIGFTLIFSLAIDLGKTQRRKMMCCKPSEDRYIQAIKIVWVIPSVSHIEANIDELREFSEFPRDIAISLDLYITQQFVPVFIIPSGNIDPVVTMNSETRGDLKAPMTADESMEPGTMDIEAIGSLFPRKRSVEPLNRQQTEPFSPSGEYDNGYVEEYNLRSGTGCAEPDEGPGHQNTAYERLLEEIDQRETSKEINCLRYGLRQFDELQYQNDFVKDLHRLIQGCFDERIKVFFGSRPDFKQDILKTINIMSSTKPLPTAIVDYFEEKLLW